MIGTSPEENIQDYEMIQVENKEVVKYDKSKKIEDEIVNRYVIISTSKNKNTKEQKMKKGISNTFKIKKNRKFPKHRNHKYNGKNEKEMFW